RPDAKSQISSDSLTENEITILRRNSLLLVQSIITFHTSHMHMVFPSWRQIRCAMVIFRVEIYPVLLDTLVEGDVKIALFDF
ncbi:hypothetical protein PMAYCL1PPCAC_11019, partial [Pristionchus mayeri]